MKPITVELPTDLFFNESTDKYLNFDIEAEMAHAFIEEFKRMRDYNQAEVDDEHIKGVVYATLWKEKHNGGYFKDYPRTVSMTISETTFQLKEHFTGMPETFILSMFNSMLG